MSEPKKNTSKEPEQDGSAENADKRSYYYDDAHGYEVYDPDADDEAEEDNGSLEICEE